MSGADFDVPIPIHTWREYKKPKAVSLGHTPALKYEFVICRRFEYCCPVCKQFWCQTARDTLDAPEPVHPNNEKCSEYLSQEESA